MMKEVKTLIEQLVVFGITGGKAGESAEKAIKFALCCTVESIGKNGRFRVKTEEFGAMECGALRKEVDTKSIKAGDTIYVLCVMDVTKSKLGVLCLSCREKDLAVYKSVAAALNTANGSAPFPPRRSGSGGMLVPGVPFMMPVSDPDLPTSLPESVRRGIERCRNASGQYERTDDVAHFDSRDLRMIYKYCRDCYPIATQRVLNDLFSRTMSTRTEHRARMLMTIHPNFTAEKVTPAQCRTQLDEQLYGMKSLKDAVCEVVSASQMTDGNAAFRVLLVGPKGVGKQAAAFAIAKMRKKPYAVIPYGCYSVLLDAGGTSSQFEGSKPGGFAEAFAAAETTDMTLILTSIQNASGEDGNNGSPRQILEEMLKGELNDRFLECPLDCSRTWIIALATDEDAVNPQVVNLFDRVIHIDALSDEKDERLHIAKQYLLPKLQAEYGLKPNRTYVTDAHLRHLLRDLCFDQGMDYMENYLRSILLYVVSHDSKTPLTIADIDRIVDSENVLKKPAAIVARNLSFFTETDRVMIRKRIEECESSSGVVKEHALQIVNGLAEMMQNTKHVRTFDYPAYMAKLNETHTGMDEPKRSMACAISHQINSNNHKGKNVLFIGPPGVGKTTLCRAVAGAAHLPFGKISCNGVYDSAYFKGSGAGLAERAPGKIFETLRATGTCALILLDEIEKIGSAAAKSSILDLLDEKRFTDNYLGVSLDVSNVVFCASANYVNEIPEELLDRFEVIELPGYTDKEKKRILREHVLPDLLANYKGCSITFTTEAEDMLVKRYSTGLGARDLHVNVEKIIDCVMLDHGTEPYSVSVNDLMKYLGPPPIEHTMSTVCRPGIAHGLAVNGCGGRVMDIEVVHSKTELVTGLVEGSCLESIRVAKTAASAICPTCAEAAYHVHIGIGLNGVRKDGSSAGVALALALISCETDTPLDPYSAFTGEISLGGSVSAVGGVPMKIRAAINAGCKRVYIPQANYDHLRAEELDEFLEVIEVIPVKTLEEVYAQAMAVQDVKAAG